MGESHPESPERLRVLDKLFQSKPEYKDILIEHSDNISDDLLLSAHTPTYLAVLEESVPEDGYIQLDGDTSLNPYSLSAAKQSVAASVNAIKVITAGECQHAFIAGRPPGHHAEPHKAMGFCLFNTVYIAAQAAKQKGLNRIAIVDFDVHHGNGTDAMMRRNTNNGFLFISTHEWPLYPGTGGPETSVDGHILNIPVQSHSGSAKMREIYEGEVFPAIEDYNPELLIVSAGFDAHKSDPLASLQWVEEDYHWLGKNFSKYKTLSNLEGGYNLESLPTCVDAYLSGLF